jgi:TPR repeat protein/uncharacterized protein
MSIVKWINKSVYVFSNALFLILWATSTNAASFACSEARSVVDRLICDDPVLSKLDDKLAFEYNTAKKNTQDFQSLLNAQRAWIQKRNSCGNNPSCIANAYNERISQLSNTQATSATPNRPAQNSPTTIPINTNTSIASLDGNWYSPQWKYGYVLKNGSGVATSTNSPNFQIGQTIIRLTATSSTTFVGQQVYTDGKLYQVNVKLLADGRLYFEGEKNAKWVMERTSDSTQNNSANNSTQNRTIDDAKALFLQGDYSKAFSLSSKLAANGDKTAQMYLGVMYAEGKGVKQDNQQAANWFQRAAIQGDAFAQLRLGEMHQFGTGILKNYYEAMRLYKLSANQGNAAAMNHIGTLHELGLGVNRNLNEAFGMYKLAAEKGNKAGQANFQRLQRAQAEQNANNNAAKVAEENAVPTAESQANWRRVGGGTYDAWYLNVDKITGVNLRAVELELLYSNEHKQIAAKDGYASMIRNIKVDCKENEKHLAITTRQRIYSGLMAHGRLLDDKKLDNKSNFDQDSVYAVAYNNGCVKFLTDYYRSTPPATERTNQSQIEISNKFKYVPKLSTAQIHEYIIKKTFSPQELNLVVSLYSFLYQFTNIVKAEPQGNYAYLKLPTYKNFIRYKEEIDNAQISIDNSLNNLAASIGLTGAQLRLASGIGMASETEGNYLTDTIRTLISNGRMDADQYVKKPGSLTKKIGNLHPDIELSPPYIFEYYSQWFPSYLESKSKIIVKVAETIDQSIAQQVAKKLEAEAEAEKRRQWLSTPEGQKYQAEQNRIARERERVAAEKLAKEFPYYAIISCGMNQQHMNVLACFAGRVGTELELRNGAEYGMYKAHEITGLGQDTQEGLMINLRSNFLLKVQNSDDQLILGVKIIQRSTNKVVFVRQAAKYQTISVSP